MAAVLQLPLTDRSALAAAAAPPDRYPTAELLTVAVRPAAPGVVVAAVRGEVDLYTIPRLQDGLLGHVYPGAPQLIVDLTGVDFFGAVGLTVLVTVREAAVAAGIRLCVVANSRPVLLPLTITGLDRMFDIYPGLPHALLSLDGGPGRHTTGFVEARRSASTP